MASRRPRTSRAPVTLTSVLITRQHGHRRCGIPGAGSGSRGGRSAGLEKTIAGRQGRDLRLSALCPICVQKGLQPTRFRRSGAYTAMDSGAVSVGSNPTGGTAQRHKFEYSDNLGPIERQACDLRRCGRGPDLVSYTCPAATGRTGELPAHQHHTRTIFGPKTGRCSCWGWVYQSAAVAMRKARRLGQR